MQAPRSRLLRPVAEKAQKLVAWNRLNRNERKIRCDMFGAAHSHQRRGNPRSGAHELQSAFGVRRQPEDVLHPMRKISRQLALQQRCTCD